MSYVHPAIVMGSNGRPYLSKRDNQGVDPTGTAPESDWQGLPITDTRTAILDPIAAVLPTGQFDQGAERVFVESAAKRFWYELRFDDTTNEYAMWHLTLPAIATSLELKFTIKWKAAATTGDVRWAVEVLAVGDDDVWDAVTGQQTLVTDSAKSTAEDVNKAELTAIVPTGGTAGDILKILLYRNASDTTNDTMTGDAKTVGVNVQMSPST